MKADQTLFFITNIKSIQFHQFSFKMRKIYFLNFQMPLYAKLLQWRKVEKKKYKIVKFFDETFLHFFNLFFVLY